MLKTWHYLVLILILGAILRFYRLGDFPAFFNDEAAVSYNAYSILKTGKDEFGKPWPLFFTSFGEGKLPLYIYQAVPFAAIFGLSELTARIPAALFGTLTILIIYFFVKEILFLSPKKESKKLSSLPVWSAFFLAIMPWHIHFSRGVFGQESLFWVLLGTWLSLYALRKQSVKYWIIACSSFSLALLEYHASKVTVPLWLGSISLFAISTFGLKKMLSRLIIALLSVGFFWWLVSFSSLGQSRSSDMAVTSVHSGVSGKIWQSQTESRGQPVLFARMMHNKLESYSRDILERYFSHFDPSFLFFQGDPNHLRYKVPNLGQLLLITLPLFLIGFIAAAKRQFWPVWLLAAISPIPAALTFETPSSVRALTLTIPLAILIAFGLLTLIQMLNKKIQAIILTTLLILISFNFIYYLDGYYWHLPLRYAEVWMYGYKEAIPEILSRASKYKEVLMTDKRGTPYIYFLLYGKVDPNIWQPQSQLAIEKDANFSFIHIRKFQNITFASADCPVRNGQLEDNVLYVCTPPGLPEHVKILKTIYYPNHEPNLYIFEK